MEGVVQTRREGHGERERRRRRRPVERLRLLQ